MKIRVKRKINNIDYEFFISDQDDMSALFKAGNFSAMPDKCKDCGSEKVHLTSNKAKGYTYVKMICEECNARSTLGQYKDGGFFWKDWKKYKKKGSKKKKKKKQKEETTEEYEGDVPEEFMDD